MLISTLYAIWPRLTLAYVYLFNYYDVFLPFMHYHFPAPERKREEAGEVGRGGGGEEEGVPGVMREDWEGGEGEEEEEEKEEKEGVLDEPTYSQLVAMFIEIILIPHFLVASYAWGWAGLNPWLAYPVIAHCIWHMWAEGKLVVGWLTSVWRHRGRRANMRHIVT